MRRGTQTPAGRPPTGFPETPAASRARSPASLSDGTPRSPCRRKPNARRSAPSIGTSLPPFSVVSVRNTSRPGAAYLIVPKFDEFRLVRPAEHAVIGPPFEAAVERLDARVPLLPAGQEPVDARLLVPGQVEGRRRRRCRRRGARGQQQQPDPTMPAHTSNHGRVLPGGTP